MAATPPLSQARDLFLEHAGPLFALCYLHTGNPAGANDLLHTLVCDLTLSPRCWAQASAGKAGLFRWAQGICMDHNTSHPKKRKKGAGESAPPRGSLPFTMTDALRAILKLSPKYKTPLYLRLALGWSVEETAQVIGGPAGRVDRLVERGLKKAGLTEERARQVLTALAPSEDGPEELWNGFLVDREDKNFAGKQRLRRFKRGLDHAIPYIALGVVVLCVLAYQGVEHGWFSGEAYVPSPDSPAVSEMDGDAPMGTFTIFAPANGGIVQYDVTDAPQSLPALVRQMVALGGAPEGTSLLSAEEADGSLSLEFSAETASWFAAASEKEQEGMLSAMTATLKEAYPALTELHFKSQGAELAAAGQTAQDLWGQALAPDRVVTTPYLQ